MSENSPAAAPAVVAGIQPAFSKHRLEGLTDGIYAVAMTLLAIDLKFPEPAQISDNRDLVQQLLHLFPHFMSWALSFAILGIFWFAHQKAFHYTRTIDTRLVVINLFKLAMITLLPFCSMLIGAYPNVFAAHFAYALDMAVLAILSLRQMRYIASRPELAQNGLSTSIVDGVAFRCWGLVACAALAVVVAWFFPRFSSMSYMAMMVITPVSRRFERRWAGAAAAPPAA